LYALSHIIIHYRLASTGGKCGSGTEMAIVGEETGEPVIGTGELYAAVTPNLHLQAYLTTKVFLAPKYHPNAQGVVPDVPIATRDTSVTVGQDLMLERTLAMIESGKKPSPAAMH
jgi:hypothetical protein